MANSKDTSPKKVPAPAPVPIKVPPLFRPIDWLGMAITFAFMAIIYFLTLAPEVTLQDSGELVTGAYYAAIPHPPGYPVWTIYSWLWTALVPVGNIAWRSALGQAAAGALACGLLSLMVSRGSSMIMEGIEELKQMTGRWESAICLVSGVVAGLMVGLDGFMWSESIVVNRISVFGVPWIMLVLICLLRWTYAPQQMRYTYWALFIFGVCITIHQSLFVSVLGIQIALAMGKPKLGRDVFFGNSVIYLAYNAHTLYSGHHLVANLGAKSGMLLLFHLVGIASMVACFWLAVRTKGFLSEWKHVIIMGLLWVLGTSFYFYMPITGMTNPPMQWGYPRTVEGFFHALTRGQYEQPNPTNILGEPVRFLGQLGMLVEGLFEEFNWIFLALALVPFLFYFKMSKRERTWLVSLAAIYGCQGVLLVILLNPTPDRASSDLVKVFFNSSHMVIACLSGYGIALVASFMATQYTRFRNWGLIGGACAAVLAFFSLWKLTGLHYFGPAGKVGLGDLPHWIAQAFAKDQYGLPIYAGLLLVAIAVIFLVALALYRDRAPLAVTLGLFLAMPLHSGMSHWFDSEQRDHMFGYWFGHDMFTPPFKGKDTQPLYPEMTKDAVLFGGTDPGRFCPTYMVFCESFTPHPCQPAEDQKFDRRDVYIITQNALADGTYLNYIRAHYNRSTQIDPPFFSELTKSLGFVSRMVSPLDTFFTRLGDQVEKRRRVGTSYFTDKDFPALSSFAAKLKPGAYQDPCSKWIYEHLDKETQTLLTGQADTNRLAHALARGLNQLLERELTARKRLDELQKQKMDLEFRISDGGSASLKTKLEDVNKEIAELGKVEPLYSAQRYPQSAVTPYLADFIKENPQSHTRIRLNRLLLESAYPEMLAKSIGGVYPDREIYIPTVGDSQDCFNQYISDAQRRLSMNPPQRRPGEEVSIGADGRFQVSGQVAVMAINGLLTKVIFDHNPGNEFFIEESFALDWMYPYLSPYGIIMKINREPLPMFTEDVLRRDHEFWMAYSKRLTGDFIDYDTPVKKIVDWIEKTYLRKDFSGFTGDRKFIRDEEAQKAFSKLRSAIGGIYAWRLSPQCPAEFRPKNDAEQQRLLKEADFAFRQSFAFCPFSPEALYRYVNLLANQNRFDDALLLAETCKKFDPENKMIQETIGQLSQFRQAMPAQQSQLQQLEREFNANPANVSLAQNLANYYSQQQQTAKAFEILDKAIAAVQGQYQTSPANHSLVFAISTLLQQRQKNDEATQVLSNLAGRLETETKQNPANVEAALYLAQTYHQTQKKGESAAVLEGLLARTNLTSPQLVTMAQIYSQLGMAPQLERVLNQIVALEPNRAEAWFDLSALQAMQNKLEPALKSLTQAMTLRERNLKANPAIPNFAEIAAKDGRFAGLHANPEFKKLAEKK
jgi:thioredoxin-like negative regulator of GroEL